MLRLREGRDTEASTMLGKSFSQAADKLSRKEKNGGQVAEKHFDRPRSALGTIR